MDFIHEIFGEALILSLDTIVLGFCIKQLYNCKNILNALQVRVIFNVFIAFRGYIELFRF